MAIQGRRVCGAIEYFRAITRKEAWIQAGVYPVLRHAAGMTKLF